MTKKQIWKTRIIMYIQTQGIVKLADQSPDSYGMGDTYFVHCILFSIFVLFLVQISKNS